MTEAATIPPATNAVDGAAESPAIGAMSQWQLIRLGFARHKLAVLSLNVLFLLYLIAAFAEFFSPYTAQKRNLDLQYCPPQLLYWSWSQGLHVHAMNARGRPSHASQNLRGR